MKINILLCLIMIYCCSCENNAKVIKAWDSKGGVVQNPETAKKIAEAIWLPIYGEDIYQERPFNVKLKDDRIWIVTGTLHSEMGGVAYIEIQKSDCKILKVTHGK